MIRLFARAALAGATLVALAAPAFAHITLEVAEAPVGSTYKAVLRVPHGCNGSATTDIRVRLPEGFLAAKPMPKPGWSLDIKSGAYAKSYELYGQKVTEGPLEISWSGGDLPDAQYDEFVFRGTLAADLAPGETLFFPVIQTCASGEEDWIDTSGSENGSPAPGLKLVPATGAHH